MVRVVDGDTVEVRFDDGDVEDVRLLGVDTPEVHTATDPAEWEGIPTTPAGRDHLERWGERASAFASERIERGERVRLVVDPTADRRGAYGRLLVYLYDDGALVNRVLLERGYARLYASTFAKHDRFAAAEAEAREDRIGVWDFVGSTPTPTAGPLAVVEVHADADGNDHDDPNDEYVVLERVGDGTLDPSGWTVADDAGHTYTVPDGGTLDPCDRVTLYSGTGTDTERELYWGADSAVWNNGGDTVVVAAPNGTRVLEHADG